MRQRRWLELIKDYDLEIHYHPGKANVVADALSRRAHCNVIEVRPTARVICWEMNEIEMPVEFLVELYNISIEPTLRDLIIEAQKHDPAWLTYVRKKLTSPYRPCIQQQQNVPGLETKVLVDPHEAGNRQICIECHVCKRVKADHLKPARYASPLKHPGLEVGRHTHGFCGRVATHSKGYDSIWVIIDRFTKSAHFIPVKTSYTAATYAELYIARIVSLHGVPVTITSDRGSSLGTKLIHGSAYHPRTSGQVERANQILEDMLRARVLTYSTKWDECLPLAEFAYNNGYQKSLEMAPFEALVWEEVRNTSNRSNLGERVTFGPDLVTQAEEQVRFIRENLKRARSRREKLLG
ncbi:hypothetical protein U9M48_003289 [Paspalum notatum var. saurae]|uniref:Integrase catalytic domain-containing protein n=1 Tax=Paspalum notatum var. saurae TaxID=547442 RepID=A0AAQ3PSF9_PASNO